MLMVTSLFITSKCKKRMTLQKKVTRHGLVGGTCTVGLLTILHNFPWFFFSSYLQRIEILHGTLYWRRTPRGWTLPMRHIQTPAEAFHCVKPRTSGWATGHRHLWERQNEKYFFFFDEVNKYNYSQEEQINPMIRALEGWLREKIAGCPLSCRTAGHLICFIQVRIALHTIITSVPTPFLLLSK